MSALGQKQTFAAQNGMSALLLKADMCSPTRDVRYVSEADIGQWVLHIGVGFLRRLSCGRATRCLPKLRGRRLPIKGVIAWTMLLQMLDARHRLLHARPTAGRHPPQHDGRPFKMLEPVAAAAVEALAEA